MYFVVLWNHLQQSTAPKVGKMSQPWHRKLKILSLRTDHETFSLTTFRVYFSSKNTKEIDKNRTKRRFSFTKFWASKTASSQRITQLLNWELFELLPEWKAFCPFFLRIWIIGEKSSKSEVQLFEDDDAWSMLLWLSSDFRNFF